MLSLMSFLAFSERCFFASCLPTFFTSSSFAVSVSSSTTAFSYLSANSLSSSTTFSFASPCSPKFFRRSPSDHLFLFRLRSIFSSSSFLRYEMLML